MLKKRGERRQAVDDYDDDLLLTCDSSKRKVHFLPTLLSLVSLQQPVKQRADEK